MSPTSTSRERARSKDLLRLIELYLPENQDPPNLDGVSGFLRRFFPSIRMAVRKNIGTLATKKRIDYYSRALSKARVKDPTRPEQDFEPMFGEVDYERRVLEGDAKAGGIVYDGRRLESVFSELLGRRSTLNTASIVMTDRLVSTYSRDDLRHHLRTVVFGFPSIISLPGIVEAPAKPREYYLLKQRLDAEGAGEMDHARLKSAFKGRYIDYGDDAIGDVLEGLALQCVIFHLTLNPFCERKDCRLFNAHWQEDLIRSQIKSKKLCRKHTELVRRLGKRPAMSW